MRIYNKNTGPWYSVNAYNIDNFDLSTQYKQLPIATVSVERTFSKYKNILMNKHANLLHETIFKIYLVLNN